MAAVDRPVAKPRPVYLNLFAIRMPLPAVVSILHRASGALLFAIGIPLALCAVQNALVSQEAWAQKERITTTLVSDLNKEAANAYGVLFKGIAGIGDSAARAAFIVDKSGVIQYSEQTPTPKDLPNFTAIKSTLAELGK